MKPIVILGSGLAGYSLLRELKNRNGQEPVVLVTADDGHYYSKPMLSAALAQKKTVASLILSSVAEMAEETGAEILTQTRVLALNPENHGITLDNGSQMTYGKLILALGSNPIRPPLQGEGAQDVLSVNNLGDYGRFLDRVALAKHVAIIGPGLIGCEFANDILQSGRKVTIIGPDLWPISTLMPEIAARGLQQAMETKGATWHLGTFNGPIEKTASGYRTVLKNGAVVEADLVLSAVGIRAEFQLALDSGLKTNRGILTDAYLHTSVPDCFALGDCAEVDGRNLPFVAPLMIGARALAATLTGEPTPVHYPAMPVLIKTSLHPVVTLPAATKDGSWQFEVQSPTGVCGRFMDPAGILQGFILTGDQTSKKSSILKEMAGK